MSEVSLVLSGISLTAAVVCVALGVYVYTNNPHLKSSRPFTLLAAIATLTAVADLLFINSPDERTALLLVRPEVFLSTLLSATMLYMTSYLPYERESSWLVRHRREFAAIALFLAIIPSATIGTVSFDDFGWGIPTTLPVVWWYAVICFFYLSGLVIWLYMYREEEGEVRRRMVPLAVGITVPVASGVIVTVLMLFLPSVPPDLSLSLIVSSLCIAYAIFRQKLFMLKPAKESVPSANAQQAMRPGKCILLEGAPAGSVYDMFVNEIAASGRGLLITHVPPEEIKEQYGLTSTPIVWLTTKPGADRLDPTSLALLAHTTNHFLQKAGGSVILLDCLDYLLANNKPEDIIHFVYGLKDAVTVIGSRLIVSVDQSAIGKKELALMEREMDVVADTLPPRPPAA